MTAQSPSFHFPNKMGRILLLSMEEILGRSGVNAILNLANLPHLVNNYPPCDLDQGLSFTELGQLNLALEQQYGVRGGHGLALRSGRASFKYALREFGEDMGCTDVSFRMLPLASRLKTGGMRFAQLFNHYTNQQVLLEEAGAQYLWKIKRCPLCWERKASVPVCHLAVGVLQEALYWFSCGKQYKVEETHCIARGDECCIIAIDKQPLSG